MSKFLHSLVLKTWRFYRCPGRLHSDTLRCKWFRRRVLQSQIARLTAAPFSCCITRRWSHAASRGGAPMSLALCNHCTPQGVCRKLLPRLLLHTAPSGGVALKFYGHVEREPGPKNGLAPASQMPPLIFATVLCAASLLPLSLVCFCTCPFSVLPAP